MGLEASHSREIIKILLLYTVHLQRGVDDAAPCRMTRAARLTKIQQSLERSH